MASTEVRIIRGFPEHLRGAAARLYFSAFEAKIGGLLGGKDRGQAFIARVMDPRFAICAVHVDTDTAEGTDIAGIAGFKTSEGSLTGGEWRDLVESYGWLGALWRVIPLSLLERPLQENVLLMDGIAVAENDRGKGIGTQLLNAIAEEAAQTGCEEIRLDVIAENPRARKLYERNGFVAKGTEQLGPLKYIFGFSAATTMVRKTELAVQPNTD